MRELKDAAPDRPYVFHLGAQAHVGESWHRPYETVAANVGRHAQSPAVGHRLGLELEKFDTAGTSEEYGNVRESVADHHDFDDAGGLILHERSPINPKSIYATSKVAADFLTMNYYDAFGVPGVVTRMFNNYGPRQNPRYVTGTIITQALDARHHRARRTSSRCGTSATARTASVGISPLLRRDARRRLRVRAGRRTSRCATGPIDNAGRSSERILVHRRRLVVPTSARHRPGSSDVLALRVGHEKLTGETGWTPKVSWEDGCPTDDPLVRGEPRPLDRPCRLALDRRPARNVLLEA